MTTVKEVVEQQEKPQVNLLHRTLDKTKALIKKFIVADEDVMNLLVVWIAHTYIWEELQYTPYLNIWSAERESGKSTVFSWLKILCKNAFMSSGATTSAIQRTVDNKKPTLLFDEVDAVFVSRNLTPEQKELIAFFNSGFEVTGMVIKTRQSDMTVQEFTSFCPKAFASIGADVLPDTTRSRSIHLPMYRKTASEVVERNRQRNRDKYQDETAKIINGLNEWSEDTQCYDEVVEMPDVLSDRSMDIYEPLFQIANEAGKDWLEDFTESAIHLSGRKDTAIEIGTNLLIDTHAIITDNKFPDSHLMYTTWYIDELCEFEESPWSTYTRQGRISTRAIAGILKKYGITPQRDRSARGYVVGDFKDPIERFAKQHMSPDKSVTSVTSVTPNRNEVTEVSGVTDKNGYDEYTSS
jgi:hypothetical protein